MAVTGGVPLLESAKWSTDLLTKGVVDIFIRESPIFETLPFETIVGNALQHNVEDTLPTVSYRDVNDTYTPDAGSDVQHFWGTTICGGEVYVDNYIVRTRGNVASVKMRQFKKKAKVAAMQFDKSFFHGTGTAKDFKGLNTLISEGFGQDTDTAGSSLSLDDLDIANDLLRLGSADVMLTNRTLRRRITKLARTEITGVALIDVGTDAFGRQVTQWNSIPIRIVGDGPDGNLILGMVENGNTALTGSDTGSIYFIKYGIEEGVFGLLGGGGTMEVVDFGEQQAKPGHMGRIEFYPGIAVWDKYALVRLYGCK